jgi:hypothetical protein
MCQNLDLQLLLFYRLFVKFFLAPFHFLLSILLSFLIFQFGFLSPFVSPFFFAFVLSMFFLDHVVSSPVYLNLLGNKRLGCCLLLYLTLGLILQEDVLHARVRTNGVVETQFR